MKKVLYMILLVAEFVLGILILNMTRVNFNLILALAVAVVWIGVVAWQAVQLKKTEDEAMIKKMKRRIAWLMLLPVAVPVVMVIATVLTLFGII